MTEITEKYSSLEAVLGVCVRTRVCVSVFPQICA